MAKLYGEFLIEKKLATDEQVLDALLEQLRSVPSTAEIIYELNLLKKSDLLRILTHQQHTGSDFHSSAKSLGLWNKQISQSVMTRLQELRRPLGEILVGRGHLTLAGLTAALDGYIECCGSNLESSKETALSPLKVQEPPLSTSCRESLDPILVKEYLNVYESRIRPSLQAILKNLDETPEANRIQLQQLMSSALSEFVGLRASAGFLGAKRCEAITNETVRSLEHILKLKYIPKQQVLIELLTISAYILDGLAEFFKDFNSEVLLNSDPNMLDLIERLSKLNHSLSLSSTDL